MKKRRWRRYAYAAMLIGVATAVLWLLVAPRPDLTQKNLHRIRIGMTLAEVEELVKAPPGDYSLGLRYYGECIMSKRQLSKLDDGFVPLPDELATIEPRTTGGRIIGWWGRSCALVVEVDDQQIVSAFNYGYCSKRPAGWFAGSFWWIDRQLDGKD